MSIKAGQSHSSTVHIPIAHKDSSVYEVSHMANTMKSAGAKNLMEMVAAATGFEVVVDTVEGINEEAQMISARPEMPVHSIQVNKAKLAHAEYIVAAQCAMLLRLWSEPKRIPVFKPNNKKLGFLADKMAKSKPLNQFPEPTAAKVSMHMAQGLLNQLRSMPLEIMAVRDCREICPDLHEQQTDMVEAHLRMLSGNFAPKTRSISPDQTWRQSVSMSAAYALNWSRLSGSALAMLPYQSAGFAETGAEFLADIDTRQSKTSAAYVEIVDTWAERLGLSRLYEWEYRSVRP